MYALQMTPKGAAVVAELTQVHFDAPGHSNTVPQSQQLIKFTAGSVQRTQALLSTARKLCQCSSSSSDMISDGTTDATAKDVRAADQ